VREREAAWTAYRETLEPHGLTVEQMEFAEADWKAGYDAGQSTRRTK
jgi:hypothetical protein